MSILNIFLRQIPTCTFTDLSEAKLFSCHLPLARYTCFLVMRPSFHVFPHLFSAMYRAELAAVWPKSPATGTTLEGTVCVCGVCVCECFLVCFCSPAREPVLACVRTHARLALSVRSGFNWMIDALLTLTVSVIQTLGRSHRLQQAPPLRIKANLLSPARWRWSND